MDGTTLSSMTKTDRQGRGLQLSSRLLYLCSMVRGVFSRRGLSLNPGGQPRGISSNPGGQPRGMVRASVLAGAPGAFPTDNS